MLGLVAHELVDKLGGQSRQLILGPGGGLSRRDQGEGRKSQCRETRRAGQEGTPGRNRLVGFDWVGDRGLGEHRGRILKSGRAVLARTPILLKGLENDLHSSLSSSRIRTESSAV